MKPKLELVNVKNFRTEETTKHDLDLKHIGKLRLVTEVFPDGAMALIYLRRGDEASIPKELDTLAKSLGAELHPKPVLVRIVALNRLEKLLRVSMRWKVAWKLAGMKTYLINCDDRMRITKEISKQLVGTKNRSEET